MTQITVKNGAGADVAVELPLPSGRAAAASSKPVALSNEDLAVLNAIKAFFNSGAAAASSSLAVTTSKDEAKVTDVTMTPDTSALSSGDVICDTQQVAGCMKAVDAGGVLNSFVLIDEADQGAALTVYLLGANVSMGTENAQPSITDANADTILGWFDIAVTDYRDVGGAKVAFKSGLAIGLKPVSGTSDIYLAIVNGTGTPTYTASSLKARLGVVS